MACRGNAWVAVVRTDGGFSRDVVVVTNGTGPDLESCGDAASEPVLCGRYKEDDPDQTYFDGVCDVYNVPDSDRELVRQKVRELRSAERPRRAK
jgi:hypothetical protein